MMGCTDDVPDLIYLSNNVIIICCTDDVPDLIYFDNNVIMMCCTDDVPDLIYFDNNLIIICCTDDVPDLIYFDTSHNDVLQRRSSRFYLLWHQCHNYVLHRWRSRSFLTTRFDTILHILFLDEKHHKVVWQDDLVIFTNFFPTQLKHSIFSRPWKQQMNPRRFSQSLQKVVGHWLLPCMSWPVPSGCQ